MADQANYATFDVDLELHQRKNPFKNYNYSYLNIIELWMVITDILPFLLNQNELVYFVDFTIHGQNVNWPRILYSHPSLNL